VPSSVWVRVFKRLKHSGRRRNEKPLQRKSEILAKMEATDYSAWSNEKLIERVTQLEADLKKRNERLIIPRQIVTPNTDLC
jgi:hypothetical protein